MGEDFENFLERKLIDRNLKCKKIFNEETDEEYYEKYINLSDIDKLNINEEELDFIFKYLEKQGIKVYGSYQCYVGIYDNYKLKKKVHYYKNKKNIFNNEEKILEYQKTKDISVRNEIVEANMKLVNYLSFKYGKVFKIDCYILESYGYEGLIKAIDQFDSLKGKFSSHLSTFIRNYIFQGIVLEKFGSNGTRLLYSLKSENKELSYFEYFYILSDIERVNKTLLKDNPDMIELVINRFEKIGDYSKELLSSLKTKILIKNPYSLEQLGDQLVYNDDGSLYNDSIESFFQEELSEMIINYINDLENRRYQDVLISSMLNDETLQHIGERYNTTKQDVCGIKQRALKKLGNKLRSYKNKEIVNSFLENINHKYGDVKRVYIKRR